MHFYMSFAPPVFIQAFLSAFSTFEAPFFQALLLGKNVARPWLVRSPPNPLASLFGQQNAEQNVERRQEDEGNESKKKEEPRVSVIEEGEETVEQQKKEVQKVKSSKSNSKQIGTKKQERQVEEGKVGEFGERQIVIQNAKTKKKENETDEEKLREID